MKVGKSASNIAPGQPPGVVEVPPAAGKRAGAWFVLTRDRRRLAEQWLVLATGALIVSGVLALALVATRTPLLAQYFTATDLARRVLVVHVGLGVVVWFSALPLVLFHLHPPGVPVWTPASRWAAVAPWLSAVGAAMLLAGLLPGFGSPHSVNYVPLVTHPIFVGGLALFFVGVALSYLDRGLFGVGARPPARAPGERLCAPVASSLASSRKLVRLGGLYVLLSLVALCLTLLRLPAGFPVATRLEILMWAPGHILQFANVAFVLVAWAMLAAWATGRPLVGEGRLRWVTVSLALPLLPILVLVAQGPGWASFRAGFTSLMQWGLFPAVLLFLALLLVPHARSSTPVGAPPSRAALWPLGASIALMLVGFVYGAMIRGSDLRIPGHYHACIGSVTLAYMALTLLLPTDRARAPASPATLRRVSVLYGSGQFLFSTGLMLAGGYGIGRKLYGVEQQADQFGQQFGLGVMAAGGLLASAAGAVWAVAMIRRFRASDADPGTSEPTGDVAAS